MSATRTKGLGIVLTRDKPAIVTLRKMALGPVIEDTLAANAAQKLTIAEALTLALALEKEQK
jgi:hypothetical protein